MFSKSNRWASSGKISIDYFPHYVWAIFFCFFGCPVISLLLKTGHLKSYNVATLETDFPPSPGLVGICYYLLNDFSDLQKSYSLLCVTPEVSADLSG